MFVRIPLWYVWSGFGFFCGLLHSRAQGCGASQTNPDTMKVYTRALILLKFVHFKKTVTQSSFLSKDRLCFDFSTFERNEDCATVI